MNLFQEVRRQVRAKVEKRRKYLEEKYRDTSMEELDAKVVEETTGIRIVSEMLNHDVSSENARRRHISVTTSEQEAWYRETMSAWITQHPEVGVDSNNSAGLYRFAMRFFVENIVLNPRNTMVSYSELISQMNRLNNIDPVLTSLNFQLGTKLEDIRELVSFTAAMTHMDSIRPMTPDRDLGNGVLSRDIHTEIEDETEFARDFNNYRLQRKTALANKRKRQSNEGLEFKHG